MAPDPAATLPATRRSLQTLACYVLAPAHKSRTGRIGLRPVHGGFGTPPCDDGYHVAVTEGRLLRHPGGEAPITTLRAAADLLMVPLTDDPGVGRDLPPFEPDADLMIDVEAARLIGDWFALGGAVLERVHTIPGVASVSDAQLWPEHFDLAVVVDLDTNSKVNAGFSPGDDFSDEPYVYVGPHDTSNLADPFWNAPFGAVLARGAVVDELSPADAALGFITRGLGLLV